ncbi:hypothetical protein EVAR_22920_1 [Eumeta japonica]|uniref:Uncharacterized protein n=1 Tax=Eumeta variegata TaxID=151549 RepID=A0A4C1UUP5_EUMVA|nr:hypothetical protein EVAR_22920_1 [Eumeta japonica]
MPKAVGTGRRLPKTSNMAATPRGRPRVHRSPLVNKAGRQSAVGDRTFPVPTAAAGAAAVASAYVRVSWNMLCAISPSVTPSSNKCLSPWFGARPAAPEAFLKVDPLSTKYTRVGLDRSVTYTARVPPASANRRNIPTKALCRIADGVGFCRTARRRTSPER